MAEVGQIRTVWDSVSGVGARLIDFLPSVAGAVVTLVVGFFLARFIGRLVERALRALGLDRVIGATVLGKYVARLSPPWTGSHILGALTVWFLGVVTIQAAVGVLALPELSRLLGQLIGFLPVLALSAILLVVGAVGARVLGGAARGCATTLGYTAPERVERIVGAVVMVLAAFAALSQLGIAPVVVNTVFIGFVGAVALAVGLAFGLGGRGAAAEFTQRWLEQGHRIVTSGELGTKPGAATTHGGEHH